MAGTPPRAADPERLLRCQVARNGDGAVAVLVAVDADPSPADGTPGFLHVLDGGGGSVRLRLRQGTTEDLPEPAGTWIRAAGRVAVVLMRDGAELAGGYRAEVA